MSPARRAGLAVLLFGLLVADSAYWAYCFEQGETDAAKLLLYPERLDGQEIVLSLVKVVEVGEAAYRVETGKLDLEVVADPTGVAVGDELYVGGLFRAVGTQRRVEEQWRELAPDRGNKKLFGILGLLATGGLMPFVLGWRRDGLVLRG